MDVFVFKTVQGIDLIGKLKNDTDTSYEVEDVLAVAMQGGENGNINVGLMPAVHPGIGKVQSDKNGAIKSITLSKAAVLFAFAPSEEIENYYTQMVSGFEVVKNMPSNMGGMTPTNR